MPHPRSPGRTRLAAVAGLLLGLPLGLAQETSAQESSAQEARSPSGLSVSVRAARGVCFSDRVEVTGVLVARQEVDVGPEREGLKVTQVLVEPLEKVAAGQSLANLGPMEGVPGTGTTVRSGVAGTVLRSEARVGSPVSPRQEPLFRIMAGGEVDLQADVALADLPKLAAGQAVTIAPLGLADVAGRVRRVDRGIDPASQLGRARIALAATDAALRVGTFARGVIVLAERCGIGVPYSAIQYEADGTIVHTVEDDRVVTRQVTTGLLSGTDVEILTGLTESDTVVVRAGAFLRDGDRVNPILRREPAGGSGPR
ncbi:efflux RND transporter periplasmic adaptor subunit [Methylobacterium sp. Leaf108]|uniref:efflux RND transporter periplasmic adaptor subunit n=1 Tax=Methylobacterium sp. Leaf108 TaxID=1736256 RepID=UPI0009EAE57F|nr:efflux RND transporter periplasmic adaptor subunit [Methylobacterium sp. Leaf108]